LFIILELTAQTAGMVAVIKLWNGLYKRKPKESVDQIIQAASEWQDKLWNGRFKRKPKVSVDKIILAASERQDTLLNGRFKHEPNVAEEQIIMATPTPVLWQELAHYVGRTQDIGIELVKVVVTNVEEGYSHVKTSLDIDFKQGFNGLATSVEEGYNNLATSLETNTENAYQRLATTLETIPELENVPISAILAAVVIFLLAIIRMIRMIRNRALHKKRYGRYSFPPYAPGSKMKTIAALTGPDLPWYFLRSSESVGPIFRVNLPFVADPIFAVGDLDAAKEILQDSKTLKPESMYASVASLAGGPNIFTSEGPKWKMSRKGVSPAFKKNHLNRLQKVCKENTEKWIREKLEPVILADEPFDLVQDLVYLTLTIICKTALEYSIQPVEATYLVNEFEIAMQEYAFDAVNNPLRVKFGMLIPTVRRARLARSRIHSGVKKILKAYRDKPKKLRDQESIISCIVHNEQYESDDHRVADIIMILFAGHDSTAHSLAWILYELARHPDELMTLREALRGNDDGIAHDMLQDVVREGMRLHPVNPWIGIRTVRRDFFLKDHSFVIPKGSQVIFPSLPLTRNNVPDAELFQPSRWRDDPDRNFLLFSAGRRNCVGQMVALAEITYIVSRLCAEYEFEVIDEGRTEFCAGTMKCAGARLKAYRVTADLGRSNPQMGASFS
jgi:cytochrome P450